MPPPQFCSQCGARLTVAQHPHCPACGFVMYRNPAPVGLAVVEYDGQLVLIRRALAPLAGYWAPPAGHIEIGESVPEAVRRETQEETGLVIALEGLIDVYSQADVNVLIVAYRARAQGGVLRAGDDASDIALFAPGQLPAQAYPAQGTATDRWLHGVIEAVTAPWQPKPQRSGLGEVVRA